MAYRQIANKITWRHAFSIMAISLFALQLADSLITRNGLDVGCIEANIFMARIAGKWWFILLKCGITGALIIWLYKRANALELNLKYASIALGIVVTGYIGLVIWNLFVCRMMC